MASKFLCFAAAAVLLAGCTGGIVQQGAQAAIDVGVEIENNTRAELYRLSSAWSDATTDYQCGGMRERDIIRIYNTKEKMDHRNALCNLLRPGEFGLSAGRDAAPVEEE